MKVYSKPTLTKRQILSTVTAQQAGSNGRGNGMVIDE